MRLLSLLVLLLTFLVAPHDAHTAGAWHVVGTVALGLFGLALWHYEDA